MGTSERFTLRWQRIAWIVAVLAPVLAVIAVATWIGKASLAATTPVPAEVASLDNLQNGLTWVAKKIEPSVVFIEVEQKVETGKGGGAQGMPDLRDLIPDLPFSMPMPDRPQRQPTPRIPYGQGSGVIVGADGYILTNEHVIDNAAKITVHLSNGDPYPAQLVQTDPLTDLAVIKIEPNEKLIPATLGDADQLKVGAFALAVGYPFGGTHDSGRFDEPMHYAPTFNFGIISALDRQLPSENMGHPFRNLIQTDAPINPGNSGGPLVNIRAQVIGINQAIYTSGLSGGNVGVGFAIPINARTRSVIDTIKGGKKVVRGRIGLSIIPLTEAFQKVYGSDHGVFVAKVEGGSPADKAGFKAGDVILSLEGRQISSQLEFVDAIQATKPGTTVSVEVLREGKRLTLKPTVVPLSTELTPKQAVPEEPKKLGLIVEAVPEELAQRANINGGVRIKSVDPVSDGARAGLQADDIIVQINRQPVKDIASYRAIVDKLKVGDPAVFMIWRRGEYEFLEIPSLSE